MVCFSHVYNIANFLKYEKKRTQIILIPKPGKTDMTFSSTYRPIRLISEVGKKKLSKRLLQTEFGITLNKLDSNILRAENSDQGRGGNGGISRCRQWH